MSRAECIEQASQTREIKNVQEDDNTVSFLPYYCSWYQFMFPRRNSGKDGEEIEPSQK